MTLVVELADRGVKAGDWFRACVEKALIPTLSPKI